MAYFYDGLAEDPHEVAVRDRREERAESQGEVFARKETLDLIHAYYSLDERPRRRLLDLAKSLNDEGEEALSA